MWEKEPLVAIELVKRAKVDFFAGNPWKRVHPHRRIEIKVPLMYNGFVLDLIHFDPVSFLLLPKGLPGVMTELTLSVDLKKIKQVMENAIKEFIILPGVEFREPEDIWIVPVAYKNLIVAHIRVSEDGSSLVPDYHATTEMRFNV